MALLSRRALVLSPAAAMLRAAPLADWKDAAFPNWSDDAVLRLLVDSPWAKRRTVKINWYGKREASRTITPKDVPGTSPGIPGQIMGPGGSPVGGIGAGKVRNKLPDGADLIFRWASALPVRQARALYRVREQKGDPAQAAAMVEARGTTDYVFEVFGIPTMAAHAGTAAISARITKSAAMRTKGGRVIRASSAETEISGDVLTTAIYFPRGDEPLRLEDREVEVLGNFDIFDFAEKFSLKPMRYLDSLEI